MHYCNDSCLDDSNLCGLLQKFFVRCLKQDTAAKFMCPRKKDCDITKETRTQCQYCRYQKCLAIGMYKPGQYINITPMSPEDTCSSIKLVVNYIVIRIETPIPELVKM